MTAIAPAAGSESTHYSLPATRYSCAIDSTDHDSLEALHAHLRKLKVTQERYYTEFAPKRDRCTGDIIPFKAPASRYLQSEFLNKANLRAWFRKEPEAARVWAIDFLRKRKEEKHLTCAPCQVELRSLLSPTRFYYDSLPGGYAKVAADLGLDFWQLGQTPAVSPLSAPILVDNREQRPLFNPDKESGCQWSTLVYGDYGLPSMYNQGLYIERKSLSDFIGTFSSRETRAGDSNIDRFARELERARETGDYLVMVVEQSLDDCLIFHAIPHLAHQFSRVRVTPDHLFRNLRELLHEYSRTFQVVFVDNRTQAKAAVLQLLSWGPTVVKLLDLQYEYEAKRFLRSSLVAPIQGAS